MEITEEKRVYDEYLKIDEAIINDSGKTYKRYALNRPDATAVLIYNSDEDTVVLVKQHRYPVQVHGGIEGNVFEIVAGKLNDGEDPKEAAIRETKEEVGYDIEPDKLFFMSEYFPSLGYSSEVVHLYCAVVTNAQKTSEGGGLIDEHENIEIHHINSFDFFKMISTGEIIDGKTIMGANAFWHLRNDHLIQLGREYAEILQKEKESES